MPDPCFPGSVAPTQLSYFSSGFSMFLIAIITVGNALIILAVAIDPLKRLRNPFAFFLVNAAVSDFVVGTVAMPVSAIFHYKEAKQEIDMAFIYILHLTYFISATASLVSMAAMAIDRYFTLVSFAAFRRTLTLRRSVLVSTLIWILAFGFSGLYFLTGFVTLVLIYVNVALVSSFGITLLTYAKVIRQMKETRRTMRDDSSTAVKNWKTGRALLREKKVTKVFMSMLIAFICLYLPTTVSVYILQFCLTCSCDVRHVFRDIAFLLVSAASATNPIICLLRMPMIRQSINAIAKCRNPSKQENPISLTIDITGSRVTSGAHLTDNQGPVVLTRYEAESWNANM